MKREITYISIKKPIEIRKFALFQAPCGWYRLDNLKKRLKEDKDFREKFTLSELK